MSTNLNRELEDAKARLQNPFDDDANKQLRLRIEQTRRYDDLIKDINDKIAVQEELAKNPKQAIAAQDQIYYLEEQKKLYQEILPEINKIEQAQLRQQQILEKIQPFTDALAQGITDIFVSFVDGTKSAEEAAVDMIRNIANSFINAATEMIAKALQAQTLMLINRLLNPAAAASGGFNLNPLGGLGFSQPSGRAQGGPVNQNTPYIVGEQGPELFVPGKSGTIVNNDAAFGDAAAALTGASQAFADSNEAMEMAMATRSSNTASAAEASAMQTAETYFATGKSTVKFDTYRVGEMDVVTREDAIRIGQQSAKQAEANVYKGLRNMPAVRGRSGVK